MANRFGSLAAASAAAASLGYGVPQVLQVLGLLTDPWDRILIFAPSLALAPAFVLTVVGVHAWAPAQRRIWSLAALTMAILYAADVSQVYVVQLGAVIPHDRIGEGSMVALAACCRWRMPATAIDLLGYTYMSFSMLLLVPVFPGNGTRRRLRWALLANGGLGPIIFAQLAWPGLIVLGALWLLSFPLAMVLLARVLMATPAQHEP
jgi:hypothetical protein